MEVAEALVKNHHVVAIDVRGHGTSDKPKDAAMYGDRIWKDVLELMDHLKIEKAHIHGYSMGGAITTQLLIAGARTVHHRGIRWLRTSANVTRNGRRKCQRIKKAPTQKKRKRGRRWAEAQHGMKKPLGLVRQTWRDAFSKDIDTVDD